MRKVMVSVVMPVFNSQRYIKESLESVLSQSFKDFELIIINDGSTDKTEQIIKSYKDKRIKIITNKRNLGVAKSLNIGLMKARGEFIARVDDDDLNKDNRFERQIKFLKKNKDFCLVGSTFGLINEKGRKINERKIRQGYTNLPETDLEIRRALFLRNPISHPSVMMRAGALKKVGFYSFVFNGAEDYELWFRLARIGKMQNIREPLILRRWHKEAVSNRKHLKIEFLALIVRLKNLPFILSLL